MHKSFGCLPCEATTVQQQLHTRSVRYLCDNITNAFEDSRSCAVCRCVSEPYEDVNKCPSYLCMFFVVFIVFINVPAFKMNQLHCCMKLTLYCTRFLSGNCTVGSYAKDHGIPRKSVGKLRWIPCFGHGIPRVTIGSHGRIWLGGNSAGSYG
jgi:hypothetical protein